MLKKEINLVEKMIRKDVATEATVKNLYEHIFKSNGKKIRSRLNLISSSLNRNKNKIHRIKLAAIIELLHTATLVHDDVVDDSSIRRGNRSVNNIWSNAHGVLIGDYIYSKAFMYMVDIGNQQILQELSNATNDISQGELIQLDAINNKEISYSPKDIYQVELAYAISIHKSQGSEYSYTILPISSEHEFMLSRNLIYTGVTRGKKKVTLIGELKAFQKGINDYVKDFRYTNLTSLISKTYH